jgi:hypothetical protein
MASTRAVLCKSNRDTESKGVALAVSDDMNLIMSTIGGNLELSTLFKTPL